MLGMQTGHAAGGQRPGCVLPGNPYTQGWRRQAASLRDQRGPLRVWVSEGPCWGDQACEGPMVLHREHLHKCQTAARTAQKHRIRARSNCRHHLVQPMTSLHRGQSGSPQTRHPANHQVLLMHHLKYLSNTNFSPSPQVTATSKVQATILPWIAVPGSPLLLLPCCRPLGPRPCNWPSTNSWQKSKSAHITPMLKSPTWSFKGLLSPDYTLLSPCLDSKVSRQNQSTASAPVGRA